MFKNLLKFEFGFQAKQVGFWVVVIIMFLLGLLTPLIPDVFGSSLAGQKIKVNGAQMIAGSVVSWDMAMIFFGAIFVVLGILRDKTFNSLEIIHATPIKTFDMTASRMVGIYLVIFTCIFANLLGQFLGQFSPTIDAEIKGPINPLFYLQPIILFTAINALIVTAFFTLIAGLTQNRMLVFVSAIGLFFFSIMTGLLDAIDAPKWLQAIIDPFGGLAFVQDTEFWQPSERNTQLTPIFGYVGLNRIIWLTISVLTLVGIFGKFRRGLVTDKGRRIEKIYRAGETAKPYHAAPVQQGLMTDIRTWLTRTKFEYLTTVRSIPFMILAGIAAALFALIIIITVFFSPTKLVPTSMFMSSIGFGSLLIPMLIIIAFFSGEMIWRDQSAKFTELLDSTRVRNWPLLAGKWVALNLVVVTLCVIAMFIGMFVQTVVGGPPVNVSLYLRFIFLNVLPNYIAFTCLALFVQSFAPNRIVGMLAAAGVMVLFMFFIGRLPFFHPLMGFGGSSPGEVSEISPYNNWIRFQWFNVYFGALCLLFAVVSVWLWRRGLQDSVMQRFGQFRKNITPASGALAAICLAVFIGSGVKIYGAYDKVNWVNAKTTEQLRADGERLFATERKLDMPFMRVVTVDAQIYPERQEAIFKGTIKLQNASERPITEIYVNAPSSHPEDVRQLDIEGARFVREGKNAEGDKVADFEKYDVRLYKFEPPLQPQQTRMLSFETFYHAPRLADGSAISKNGTFVNNYGSFGTSSRVIPTIGAPDLRLRNSKKRRKYGLDELEKRAERTDMVARRQNIFGSLTGPADYIDFDGTVCTSEKQIPIAPGDFISETVENGRRCRNYKSDTPINNFYSFLSGEYEVREDSWTSSDGKTIPIRVYYGEGHEYSLDNMVDATKFGLTHFSEKFGPYQYNYFRIMEVPFIGFAQAFAGTIPYAEGGFVMDSGDADDVKTLDNAAQTTLHELAHQWFGHQITPGLTRGYQVLVEGLTSYAALDAYEEMYGWDKAFYNISKSPMGIEGMQALAMFDREKEVPLGVAGEQMYLYYAKADWVMWGLKHYMGRENMQNAMKRFVSEYGSKGAPYPTTLELTAVLKDMAGPEFHQLIDDYFERITWWDMSYGNGDVSVSENANGTFTVTVPFEIEKKIQTEEMDALESVTEIDGETLNEWVEIGLYAQEPKKKWSAWSDLERVRVNKSESVLSFEVKTRPAYISIDPRRLLMERNVDDNVKAISAASKTG